MSENKEKKADSLLKDLGVYLGVIPSKEEAETTEEVKEVEMEAETKEEETTEVQFASELAEGEYELVDGTKFRIDEAGNVVDVQAPTEREAEGEEEAKDVQDEMSKENLEDSKLSEATKEIEKLKEEVAELSKVKPLGNAPKKAERVQMEITPGMTYLQRVKAATYNSLNK